MDTSTPALERGLSVLQWLGDRPRGGTAAELIEAIGVPRATLYRILRVLRSRGFVQPATDDPARMVLGPAATRLSRLARGPVDVAAVLQPLMDRFAETIGETVKFVVREDTRALTVAVSHSGRDTRIAARIGYRLPLHLGASQRLLLAHAPAEVIDRVLAMPLPRIATRTLTNAATIRRGLTQLQRQGWSASHNEGVEGVGACAALVRFGDGDVAGALVTIFIYAGTSAEQRARLKTMTLAAAQEASGRLAASVV